MAETTPHMKALWEIEKEAAARSRADAEERLSKGTPTPTQEENDRAAMGEHVVEHADDGSGDDPYPSATVTFNKQAEAAGKGTYKTRESRAEQRADQRPATQHPAPTTPPKRLL
jgi:hypothetical protein